MSELDALLRATLADPEVPATVRGFLERGAKLDDLRLDTFGRWSFNGAEVENSRVAALFTRSLRRTDAGTWILEVGHYTYPVTVEGAATFIRRLEVDGTSWTGVTSTDERVRLDGLQVVSDGDTFLGVEMEVGTARFIEGAYQSVLSWVLEDANGKLAVKTPSGTQALRVDESPKDGLPIS